MGQRAIIAVVGVAFEGQRDDAEAIIGRIDSPWAGHADRARRPDWLAVPRAVVVAAPEFEMPEAGGFAGQVDLPGGGALGEGDAADVEAGVDVAELAAG